MPTLFFAELALEVGTGRLGSDGRLLRDMVAVRRSAGWVNIPLSALACRDAGGAVIEFGP